MGRRKQRLFEARFKEKAVRRMLNGESTMRLSRELDVARAVLYRWRDTYRTSLRVRGNEPSGILP